MASGRFEPQFTADTVGVLRRLQDNLRASTFELVRNHCAQTRSWLVDGDLIEQCALMAMREMVSVGSIAGRKGPPDMLVKCNKCGGEAAAKAVHVLTDPTGNLPSLVLIVKCPKCGRHEQPAPERPTSR